MDIETTKLTPLRRAIRDGEEIIAVHYACESFLTAKDHPPAVASAAVFDLRTNEVIGFSRADCPSGRSTEQCEEDLLRGLFDELNRHRDSHVLHWNMDRPEFGFGALIKRWHFLKGEDPEFIPPLRRYDVDGLFDAEFGENYAPHGKLESMARLNELDMRSFLRGKDEAAAFVSQDWATLGRSSASKARIIGTLLERLVAGSAKTAVSAGQLSFAGSRLDAVKTILALGNRFRLVQRSLSKHPHGRPPVEFRDEYDDQFLMRALLVQFFEDVRDEDDVPSSAGGNSRIDFVLPEFGLAVELKHTRVGMKDKDLGGELLIDRERYLKHEAVQHLVVLVFDHEGRLRNPRGLESDLKRDQSHPDLTVTVRIIDR